MSDVEVGRPAPRLLVGVAGVVLAVGTLLVLAGAWHTGVSTDEPFHVLRLDNYFTHGWYLLDDDLDTDGSKGSWVYDGYVYAPVTALLAHLVNVVVGNETWGHPSASAAAYGVRHEVVAVLGLATVVATGWLTRLVTGRRAWGVVGAAVLVAIPMWPGHAMFNIKDVPVGAGFTFFTLGLALAGSSSGSRRDRVVGVAAVVSGVLLAVGTRPGMWTGLVASLVAWLVLVAWRGQRHGWSDVAWRVRDLALSVAIALGLLTLIYPHLFFYPGDWLMGSARASSAYGGVGLWSLIPRGVVVGVPSLLLVLGGAGLLILLLSWRWGDAPRTLGLAVVASQALVMPVLAIINRAFLYDELRQVLFACPAWAVLFAVGIERSWQRVSADGRRFASRAYAGLAALALAVPVVAECQLFPYSYAYASEVVDAAGLDTTNDYWRTSGREIAPDLPADQFLVCTPNYDYVTGDFRRRMHLAGRATAEASNDCRTDYLSPVSPFRDFHVDPLAPVAPTFEVLFEQAGDLGDNCVETARVTRRRLWTTQVMMRSATCDLVLPRYRPATDLRFRPDDTNGDHLLGGWTSNPGLPGIELRDEQASLGWRMSRGQLRRPFRITIEYDGAAPAAVLVNNVRLPTHEPRPGWVRVRVSPDVADALGEDRLVVTLRRAETETRVLRVEARVEVDR